MLLKFSSAQHNTETIFRNSASAAAQTPGASQPQYALEPIVASVRHKVVVVTDEDEESPFVARFTICFDQACIPYKQLGDYLGNLRVSIPSERAAP